MQPRAALRAPSGPETSGYEESSVASLAAGIPRAHAIVALSEDALLLEALTHASIEQAALITSPSADRFVDQIMANGAQVALIDAAAAPEPLEEFIASLRYQFPQLLLLLAGAASLQHQMRQQIADGTVFRFAHKPASAQRLKLFVDAALRRRQTLADQAGEGEPEIERAPLIAARRWWLIGALVALGLSALGVAGWIQSHQTKAVAVSSAQMPPWQPVSAAITREPTPASSGNLASISADSPAAPQPLQATLQAARARIGSGELLTPTNDSARDYVRQALALSPRDAEVRALAKAFGEALISATRRSIAAGDATSAARWLQACRDYQINAVTLSQLSAQIAAMAPAQLPPAAAADAPDVTAADLPAATGAKP